MDQDLAPLIHHFGAVNTQFLAQALEVLDPAQPITFPDTVSVGEAIRCMKEQKIGCVLLVDENDKLSGVFSERDVVSRVILSGIDLDNVPISEVMTRNPKTEQLESSVAFALQLMSDNGFRHLPITDEEGYPLGIISVKDILDFIKNEIVTQLVIKELSPK